MPDEFDAGFDGSFDASTGTGWVSIDEAREWWRDAPYDDEFLQMLLDVAQEHVLAYGPDRIAENIAGTGVVPTNYRTAQFYETRELWNMSRRDAGTDQIGIAEFAVPTSEWLMKPSIKRIIRPPRGRPTVA